MRHASRELEKSTMAVRRQGVAKETGNEAVSSSLGAVSSAILLRGIFSEDHEVKLASCYLISATFKCIPQFLNLYISL
jgi:hypothetical protein